MKTALPNFGGADRRVFGGMTLSLVLGLVAGAARAQVPCSYDVTTLPNIDCGIFGKGPGRPTAFTSAGLVLGTTANCATGYPESFLWNGEPEVTMIERPSWLVSFEAVDINDNGIIVGSGETTTAGQRAIVYDVKSDQWTELPPTNPRGLGWSAANAINSSGIVCGFRSVDDGGDPINPYTAFIWSPQDGFTDLGLIDGDSSEANDINDNGTVTGSFGVSITAHAFLWQDGKFLDLGTLAGWETIPHAINNVNQIVGGAVIQQAPEVILSRAFLWDNGRMIDLGVLPGFNRSVGIGITDDGLVVGNCSLAGSSVREPFIWHTGQMLPLIQFAPSAPDVDLDLVSASAFGRIGVRGIDSTLDPVAMVLTPAPHLTGDSTCDEFVNVDDLLTVIHYWGQCTGCSADFNSDGLVDQNDLMVVIENWRQSA